MPTAIAKLTSVSPYSQSRYHATPKNDKEAPDDYEKRTWMNRCHTDTDGNIFIPPMAFKNCLDEAAKYLSIKIPNKGNATYTKHFEAGVLVLEPVPIGLHIDKIEGEWLFLNADGVRGGGKRVLKCYPVIRQWAVPVTFHIFDDTLTQDVFRHHLEEAGKFIGIGRFRPRMRGFYGRFDVADIDWQK